MEAGGDFQAVYTSMHVLSLFTFPRKGGLSSPSPLAASADIPPSLCIYWAETFLAGFGGMDLIAVTPATWRADLAPHFLIR